MNNWRVVTSKKGQSHKEGCTVLFDSQATAEIYYETVAWKDSSVTVEELQDGAWRLRRIFQPYDPDDKESIGALVRVAYEKAKATGQNPVTMKLPEEKN